jgi:hypothetical protein
MDRAMPSYYYLAYLFAGALLANSVPHYVQGVCGNKFQSPFASPPGVGESSAIVNVIWGWLNFVAGSALLFYFSPPLPQISEWIAAALGALIMGLSLANHFGRTRNASPHP